MKSFLPHSHSLRRRWVREAGHSVFELDAAVTNDQPLLLRTSGFVGSRERRKLAAAF
jgi:hypothetical protein